MQRRILTVAIGVGAAMLHAGSALAQGESKAAKPTFGDPYGFVSTLVFGLLGIVLATVGFKLFDFIIKADIEKEIFENKNTAAAVLAGAVVLGVSLIIAATIMS